MDDLIQADLKLRFLISDMFNQLLPKKSLILLFDF